MATTGMTVAEEFQFEQDRDTFATQLRTLKEMGFDDEVAAVTALKRAYGNVSGAIDILEREQASGGSSSTTLSGSGQARAAATPTLPRVSVEGSPYRNQVLRLEEMGFSDRAKSLQVLQQTNGNVEQAVERLLGGSTSSEAPAPSSRPSPSAQQPRQQPVQQSRPTQQQQQQSMPRPVPQQQRQQQQPQQQSTSFVNDLIDLDFNTPVVQPQPSNLIYEQQQYQRLQQQQQLQQQGFGAGGGQFPSTGGYMATSPGGYGAQAMGASPGGYGQTMGTMGYGTSPGGYSTMPTGMGTGMGMNTGMSSGMGTMGTRTGGGMSAGTGYGQFAGAGPASEVGGWSSAGATSSGLAVPGQTGGWNAQGSSYDASRSYDNSAAFQPTFPPTAPSGYVDPYAAVVPQTQAVDPRLAGNQNPFTR